MRFLKKGPRNPAEPLLGVGAHGDQVLPVRESEGPEAQADGLR